MRVDCELTVVVDLDSALCGNVISRCVDNEDDWRGTYYNFTTADEVYGHLAYNCVANGIDDVSRLDGWADVPIDACRMFIAPYSFDARPFPPPHLWLPKERGNERTRERRANRPASRD